VRGRVLVAALLLAACDATSEGRAAYRDGRFSDAHAALSRRATDRGASPELLYDAALAALRAGDHAAADAALSRVPARSDVGGLAAFLRGNVAFARCELAMKQAFAVESEPFAFDVAIAHGRTARDAWIAAATLRAQWPEARRNVERALLALDELERRKAEADPKRKKAGRPEVRLRPAPKKPGKPPNKPPDTQSSTEDKSAGKDGSQDKPEAELTPEEIRRLIERLAEKEKERLRARQARRQEKSADVERDW
jgi:hypothetical protein